MNNYITLKESVQEKIKNIGIFLWFVTAVNAFAAFTIDLWFLLDVAVFGILAYFMHQKQSSTALYWTCAYYALATVVSFDEIILTSFSLIIRAVILYWLFSTAFKAYRADKNPELLVQAS